MKNSGIVFILCMLLTVNNYKSGFCWNCSKYEVLHCGAVLKTDLKRNSLVIIEHTRAMK